MSLRTLGILGLDPENLLKSFGLIGIFAIVFAESGLLFGFFLPGDSLLFGAGLFASAPEGKFHFEVPILLLMAVCSVAAVAGDQVGYLIGSRAGPRLFNRPDSRLFKHENVERAEEFFAKHGSKAIVLARFVPIVRTFVPVVAGVSNMKYRTFVTFNVVGGLVWGAGFPLLGYTLGGRFPVLSEKIEVITVLIIAMSLLPLAFEYLRHRRASASAPTSAPTDETV